MVSFLLIASKSIFANEKNNQCKKDLSISAFIECTLLYHPDLQVLYAEKVEYNKQRKVAAQIPNPELDSKMLVGFSGQDVNGEINLQHTVELGGKIKARIDTVNKKLSIHDQTILIKQQEIIVGLFLKLHRLRQLSQEVGLIEDAISTYRMLVSRLNRLPRLNPEQTMNLELYRLSIEEQKLSLHRLEAERLFIIHENIQPILKYFRQIEKTEEIIPELLKALLPDAYTLWPKLDKITNEQSPYLALAQSEIEYSQSLSRLESSLAWPDLKIGPSAGFQNNSGEIGINFAITVPLYHQNQGQKELADSQVKTLFLKRKLLYEKLVSLRNTNFTIYENITRELKILQIYKNLKIKEAKLHSTIKRGALPASLVVELHRQFFSTIQNAHEAELIALRALWYTYSIDGTIFKEYPNEK